MTYQAVILAEPSLISFVPCTETTGPNTDVVVGDTNTVYGTAPTYGVATTTPLGGFGTQLNVAGGLSWTNPLHGASATDFSVEVWFNSTAGNIGPDESPTLFPGAGLIQADIFGSSNDWGMAIIGNSQPLFEVGNPDFTKVTAPGAYNDGNWHYAVGTYAHVTGVVQLYVDSVLIGSATTSNPGNKNGNTTFSTGLATYGWPGIVCNLAIYNSVLTQTQVTAHWDAGTNTIPPPPPTVIDVYGKFVSSAVFKAIEISQVGDIIPRIWPSKKNNTVYG